MVEIVLTLLAIAAIMLGIAIHGYLKTDSKPMGRHDQTCDGSCQECSYKCKEN